MSSSFVHLSFEEQIKLLESRNMFFQDRSKAENTLSIIPYYKIKAFARPFSIVKDDLTGKKIDYQGVNFERIVSRYYQDKNLRIHLFHVLEDIEVALKTQLSYILGKNYGAYGYLVFKNWCDTQEYCKHYLKIKEEEFINKLAIAAKKSSNSEIREKLKIDNKKVPPIWLAVELLTFGQVVNIINMMSNKNLSYIARCYDCSKEELKSWLKCLNFIRNVCAHNSNFIDTKLKTQPLISDKWKENLYQKDAFSFSNRIALPLMIIVHMQSCINSKYIFNQINDSMRKLIKDEQTANYFGFKDLYTVHRLYPKTQQRMNLNRKRQKKVSTFRDDKNDH